MSVFRRVVLASAIAGALWVGTVATANGATLYWYGDEPDCWQVGEPPLTNGHQCDLHAGRTTSNAVTGDLNTTESGDYCNAYNSTSTVCTDEGATWPLAFSGNTEACKRGGVGCGIQHYASLISQSDKPWGSWAEAPTFEISADLSVSEAMGVKGAWSYLCPIFEAPTHPRLFLEYCFDQWQGVKTGGNLPQPPFAAEGYGLDVTCANVTIGSEGTANDTFVSPFAVGQPTPYATTASSSTNTLVGGLWTTRFFQASITRAQLEAAIQRDNLPTNGTGSPTKGYGCARGLPNSPAGYRLVGIEDGMEGVSETKMHAVVSNLKAWTEYTPPAPKVAVQSNGTDFAVYPELTTALGMGGGTSPSIALLGNGGYEAAFQANTGDLYVYSSATGEATDTHLGMAAGTSPSIATLPGGSYVVAFESNTNNLYTYTPGSGGIDTKQGMLGGTSPAVARVGSGYDIAFQANVASLYIYSSATHVSASAGIGMAAGTSPAITGTASGSYVAAVESNTNQLWTYSPSAGAVNTSQGMMSSTGPSIAMVGENYDIAFQANVASLYIYSSASHVSTSAGIGMAAGTSPSITALPGGTYEAVAESNVNDLWTYSPGTGAVGTGQKMAGTSNPSIVE